MVKKSVEKEVSSNWIQELEKWSTESRQRARKAFNPVAMTIFLVLLAAAGLLLLFETINLWVFGGIVLLAVLISASIKIADQWERAVVLRLGRFHGLRGPGMFLIIPIVDWVAKYIDQRVRVTDFHAETTLTRDTVPVNVDAVVYWMVWDVQKAALEVQDYIAAIAFAAQTGLRDTIGKHELADLLQHREKIGGDLQQTLDEQTNPWGITCQSVGIKDIIIPAALEDAMSKQAQAERERQARIILGTAETEIAEKFAQASEFYRDNPVALQLRGMNMLFEGLKEKGSMVIVPSSALHTMNLGAIGGLAGFAAAGGTPKEDL
jgi:regulator of protease activity HflC (stomatin/prohibitin superfamily)